MTQRANVVVWFAIMGMISVCFLTAPMAAQDEQGQPAGEDAETSAGEAKRQRVVLKDNRELEGVVTKTATGEIEITNKFGTITVDPDEVVDIVDVATPKDAYLERKMNIDTRDAEALYELARWVWTNHGDDRELLQSAKGDLEKALELKEDYKRAELFLKLVDAKLESLEGKGAERVGKNQLAGFKEDELVTERDIYSIRIKELREDDRVVIKYENDVLDRFINLMRRTERTGWDKRSTAQQFRGLSRRRQVTYMMEQEPNNWNLQRDILIKTDPQFMVDFRSKVWPILRRTAASPKNNYGGKLMDGFKFKMSASRNERVEYTNFVILVGYKKGRVRMVDRQKPEDSLILKAGLEREIDPDIDVTSLTPPYRIVNSAEYKIVLDWIKSLKGPMEPNYHLEWKPPAGVVIDCDGKSDIPLGVSEPEEDE